MENGLRTAATKSRGCWDGADTGGRSDLIFVGLAGEFGLRDTASATLPRVRREPCSHIGASDALCDTADRVTFAASRPFFCSSNHSVEFETFFLVLTNGKFRPDAKPITVMFINFLTTNFDFYVFD